MLRQCLGAKRDHEEVEEEDHRVDDSGDNKHTNESEGGSQPVLKKRRKEGPFIEIRLLLKSKVCKLRKYLFGINTWLLSQ